MPRWGRIVSKLLMFDWRCQDCNTVFEGLAKSSETTRDCKACGGNAKRIISPVRLDWRMGVDSDMPTMADRWERMHREGRKIEEERYKRDNGPD